MSSGIWLAVCPTDDGLQVTAVADSREDARTRSNRGDRLVQLDREACAALAADHGVVVDEEGQFAPSGEDEEPRYVDTSCVLPDVWSDDRDPGGE